MYLSVAKNHWTVPCRITSSGRGNCEMHPPPEKKPGDRVGLLGAIRLFTKIMWHLWLHPYDEMRKDRRGC